ncbi:RTA1 like protein-domain-containing protein [Lipomyces doorenjongii]|uniref:RTA1 like protein-domain-containing protein n=1 Tax=Lipomyces doorenjongii TaxID=383834 RepID=UPI0034CD5C70
MDQNYTIPIEDCTLDTCPLSLAHFTYVPTLAGNAFFAGWFGLVIVLQILLAVKYRTWGYFIAMFGGVFLEIMGYIGRIQMHFNPFTSPPYLLYLICLTIAPAFLGAAVYLCLSRIVVVYGEHLSRFKPRTYTLVFITCDFISLCLQGAGGGIAATANTQNGTNLGKNIMLAGLIFQVFATILFMTACAEFAWNLRKAGPDAHEPTHAMLRSSWKFRLFLWGLGVAISCIFVRSVYRVAELSQGFGGSLANQQVTFMILEGVMIFIAAGAQTFLHPGVCFQGSWEAANFKLGRRKRDDTTESVLLSDMNAIVDNGDMGYK